jgi:hypothetical protein
VSTRLLTVVPEEAAAAAAAATEAEAEAAVMEVAEVAMGRHRCSTALHRVRAIRCPPRACILRSTDADTHHSNSRAMEIHSSKVREVLRA